MATFLNVTAYKPQNIYLTEVKYNNAWVQSNRKTKNNWRNNFQTKSVDLRVVSSRHLEYRKYTGLIMMKDQEILPQGQTRCFQHALYFYIF